VLLPALMDDFQTRGGTIQMQTFSDRAALQALAAPLVVNCTGLGPKALLERP
jgi:hypothetical protein